jgi:hypothetical protein
MLTVPELPLNGGCSNAGLPVTGRVSGQEPHVARGPGVWRDAESRKQVNRFLMPGGKIEAVRGGICYGGYP